MQPYIALEIDDILKKYIFRYYPPTLQDDDVGNVTKYMEQTKFPTGIRSVYGTRSYGSILVEMANINPNTLLDDLDKEIQAFISHPSTKEQLILSLEKIIKENHGILLAPILEITILEIIKVVEKIEATISMANSIRNDKTARGISSVEASIQEALSHLNAYELLDTLRASYEYCCNYCDLTTKYHNINFSNVNIELKCNIVLNKDNSISMSYQIEDLFTLASLDHFKIASNHIQIKACENCGKYFIPYVRSDEKYCDNYFKDGKTCKELGYKTKLKNDEFKTAYRKSYKTQHARIKYNSHIANYEEIHFKPWKKAAKQALEKYTAKNDLEGFSQWLKDNKDSF